MCQAAMAEQSDSGRQLTLFSLLPERLRRMKQGIEELSGSDIMHLETPAESIIGPFSVS